MFDHVAAGVTLDCRICSLFFTLFSVSCVNQVNVGMSRPKFQFIVARNLSIHLVSGVCRTNYV